MLIFLSADICANLPPTDTVDITCSTHEIIHRSCKATCKNPNFIFVELVPLRYNCGPSGITNFANPGETLRIPECGRKFRFYASASFWICLTSLVSVRLSLCPHSGQYCCCSPSILLPLCAGFEPRLEVWFWLGDSTYNAEQRISLFRSLRIYVDCDLFMGLQHQGVVWYSHSQNWHTDTDTTLGPHKQ